MQDQALMDIAKDASRRAYAPYSHYHVGACLLADDGRVFEGCNVENAAYGVTLCAERSALSRAVCDGARRFSAIAVYADGDAPWPCGMCRQMLYEFAPDMRVIVRVEDGVAERTLRELLPNGFGLSEAKA